MDFQARRLEHPFWPTINAITGIICITIILALNCSDLDETEYKSITWIAVLTVGGKTAERWLRSKFGGPDIPEEMQKLHDVFNHLNQERFMLIQKSHRDGISEQDESRLRSLQTTFAVLVNEMHPMPDFPLSILEAIQRGAPDGTEVSHI